MSVSSLRPEGRILAVTSGRPRLFFLGAILGLVCFAVPTVAQEATPSEDPEVDKTVGEAKAIDSPSKQEQGPTQGSQLPEEPRTRRERWRQKRLEKQQQLETYEPTMLERQLLVLEDPERRSLLDSNFWGFYPRAQFISRGSGVSFGTRFWRPNIRGRPLDVHGSIFYSVKGYEFYDLQIGRIPHRGTQLPLRSWKGDDVYELADPNLSGASRITLYGSFRYRHLPQEDFYGLGPDSRREDHTSFLQQDALYELVAGYQLRPWLALTFRGGFLEFFIGPGEDDRFPTTEELFDESTAPGLTGRPDFTQFTSQLLFDFRDEPGNPHKGVMVAAALTRFDDVDSEQFRFNRFAFDARGFIPLGTNQRVLALRLLTILDDPADGSEVPFYLQESLGGSHTLRGFDSFRFRGEKVLLMQAEYRWEASPPVELTFFGDAGTVANGDSRLGLSELEVDYGVGLRIKTYRSTVFRLDYARSHETSRLLFRVSSSF